MKNKTPVVIINSNKLIRFLGDKSVEDLPILSTRCKMALMRAGITTVAKLLRAVRYGIKPNTIARIGKSSRIEIAEALHAIGVLQLNVDNELVTNLNIKLR